jgi:hypothetical protein
MVEGPPKKGAFFTLDDPDDSDGPKGRDKRNMDGWRMDKEKAKKRAEEASLREHRDDEVHGGIDDETIGSSNIHS